MSAKDLTKQAPASPRTRIGGYAILARTIDKGRAVIAGTVGEYNFDCPLDKDLFSFKGITGADLKKQLENGASNEEVATWLNQNGTPKTPEEISAWSDEVEASSLYNDPAKKDWFTSACKELGLDPATTSLFDFLEADDKLLSPN